MNLIYRAVANPVVPMKTKQVRKMVGSFIIDNYLGPADIVDLVEKIKETAEDYLDSSLCIDEDQESCKVVFRYYNIVEVPNDYYQQELDKYYADCLLKQESDRHNEYVTVLKKLYNRLVIDNSILEKVEGILNEHKVSSS